MKSGVISSIISKISPSATIAVAAKADELKSKGFKIISFATGEPDFDTSENIKEAADQAMKAGFTKYTAVAGIKELREAICIKLKRDNHLEYIPSQIIVSNGAKQALYNAFMTICEQGDEVLLPTPCYVTFPEQIKLAGATPIYVPTKEENNFRITLEELKAKYTPQTKVFVLNSPNNPSGSMCNEDDLKQIANFLVDKGIWVITDEIYENIIYDETKHISIASLNQETKDITITVNGLSKSYAMTGWRVGYAAGPEEIISAMIKLQGHVTSNINSIAQKGAIEALTGPQEMIETMCKEYARRRNYVVKKLNSIRGISCNSPDGAFYVFPNISKLYGASLRNKIINNGMDVVNYILEEAHVAVVPGEAFKYPNHIRLSFAISMENIKEGLNRIEAAINKLIF
jgi:aspartate aminotransferase